jgi:hypothetical protein
MRETITATLWATATIALWTPWRRADAALGALFARAESPPT